MTINLLGLGRQELTAYCATLGEKPFRAKQLLHWMHQSGAADFGVMTDISKVLRERLCVEAAIAGPTVVQDTVAGDGTRKWLMDVGTGNAIETVFIPETHRGTLCISSQAGCALECSFCATGRQGFNRNLSVGEIIGQLWWANKCLGAYASINKGDARIISNVVMMGMGEPLANFDNVVGAMQLMLDDDAYGLSRRRVTLSTSGLVPAMDRLRDTCPVALAVSLHAPNDALRNELVPINKKYPIRELLAACVRYIEKAPRDFVTFEYVLLADAKRANPRATLRSTLERHLPARLAEALAGQLAMAGNLADQSDRKLADAGARLDSWMFHPNGSEGYAKAEVTRGGVSTDGLSQKTLEAKTVPGLHFIGEAVDVTGWLGGYNFQWAWASGVAAGEAV